MSFDPTGHDVWFIASGKVQGMTIDHAASASSSLALVEEAKQGRLDLVTGHLKAPADVNSVDQGGETALIHALRSSHIEAAKMPFDESADVRVCPNAALRDSSHGSDGMPARMAAACSGQAAMVAVCLAAKADANAATRRHGHTGLVLASSAGHDAAVKQLLGANARTDARVGTRAGTALCFVTEQ